MESNQSTTIWVTFKLPGIHRYPDAPEEVAYLRYPHRHLFGFKVTMQVFHDDRDVEFHMLRNWCVNQYGATLSLDHKSCEMIARELLEHLSDKYPGRSISVQVDEDGECGAVVTYDMQKC